MKFFVFFLFLASSFINAHNCPPDKPNKVGIVNSEGAKAVICYKDKSELPSFLRS